MKKRYFIETGLSSGHENDLALYNHLSDVLAWNGRLYVGISGRKFERLNNQLNVKGHCQQITRLSDGETLYYLFSSLDEGRKVTVKRVSDWVDEQLSEAR